MSAWTNPLTIALVAAGSSLLTIFVTAPVQHHFWRRQRRDELRLAAVKEFNRLATEFITGYIYAPNTYRGSEEFFKALNIVGGDIRVLFSREAYNAVERLDRLIGPGSPYMGQFVTKNQSDLIEARDAALRKLYSEVIPLSRGDG